MSTPQPYDQPLPMDLAANLAAEGAAVGEAAGLQSDTADPTEDLYDEDGLPSQIARQAAAAEQFRQAGEIMITPDEADRRHKEQQEGGKPARKLGAPKPGVSMTQFTVRLPKDVYDAFNTRVWQLRAKKQTAAEEAIRLWLARHPAPREH